jgi:hypothetical protein
MKKYAELSSPKKPAFVTKICDDKPAKSKFVTEFVRPVH